MDIERMKELIAQREHIDAELVAIISGKEKKERKTQTCSICQSPDHTARTCPNKPQL